jgi:hypothetical protein
MPGLSLEDLLGKRQDTEIISARTGALEGRQCLILTAKIENENFRYGVLPELISKVLESGRKEGEKIILRLPPPNKQAKITWINVY